MIMMFVRRARLRYHTHPDCADIISCKNVPQIGCSQRDACLRSNQGMSFTLHFFYHYHRSRPQDTCHAMSLSIVSSLYIIACGRFLLLFFIPSFPPLLPLSPFVLMNFAYLKAPLAPLTCPRIAMHDPLYAGVGTKGPNLTEDDLASLLKSTHCKWPGNIDCNCINF